MDNIMDNYKGPFIGVTGFVNPSQIEIVKGRIEEDCKDLKFFAGTLLNPDILKGKKENGPGNRFFPDVNLLPEIFLKKPNLFNIVHFYSTDQKTLLSDMLKITELAGKNLDGFQLNMNWPNVKDIEEYRKMFPEKIIMLRVNWDALETVSYLSGLLAEKISQEYKNLVDYILLDYEDGEIFSTEEIVECLLAIQKKGIGGLGVVSDYKNDWEPVTSLVKIEDLNHLSFNFDLRTLNSGKTSNWEHEISEFIKKVYDLVITYYVPVPIK